MDTLLDVNWGLFGATIALVGVTFFYAIETRNLVRVPYRPSLRPSFLHSSQQSDDIILQLQLTNIGAGIATDIEVKYSLEEDSTGGNTQTKRIELLFSHEKSSPATANRSTDSFDIIGLPSIPNDYYSQHKVILKLKLKYRDVLGKKYHYNSDLDVSIEASRSN
jgi:hypothetical protein